MIADVFAYDFLIRALVAGLLIAIIAPLIGIFLVVQRYSLMADTLAHVGLAGIAIGALLHTQPLPTAVVVTILSALGIDALRSSKKIFGESVLAIVLSGSLAIASVLISLSSGLSASLFSVLFGSITTVQSQDLYWMAGLCLTALALLGLGFRTFFYVAFDEELAAISGVPATFIRRVLILLAAATVAISMRVVGVLLIGSLMVIPVMTAILYGKGFRSTTLLAIFFSLVSVIFGFFASLEWDIASGGSMVVVGLVFFLFSLLITSIHSKRRERPRSAERG